MVEPAFCVLSAHDEIVAVTFRFGQLASSALVTLAALFEFRTIKFLKRIRRCILFFL